MPDRHHSYLNTVCANGIHVTGYEGKESPFHIQAFDCVNHDLLRVSQSVRSPLLLAKGKKSKQDIWARSFT